MKAMKMKALAVAVLGLAGIGSAMAACPTDPFVAWSSSTGGINAGAQLGGTTAGVAPGLNSTGCKMASRFTTAPGSNGEQAIVYDDTPNAEQHYRFRFYVDPTNIASALSTVNTVQIFNALSTSSHATGPAVSQILTMQVLASGGNIRLRTFAACTAGDNFASNRCRSTSGDLTLSTVASPAPIRIEGEVVLGGAGVGVVNVWVGSNVVTGTPDRVINVNNAAWSATGTPADGVERAAVGLFGSTPGFRTGAVNQDVFFDEFDSRRSTFIGL